MMKDDISIAGYEWLATAAGVAVFQNKNALPRAFFVDRAIAAASHADALAALGDESFDARREVVIDNAGGKLDAATSSPETSSGNAATIIADQRNRVVIETVSTNAAWLGLRYN